MRGIYTPVTDIRRKVFTEVARMAYEVNELSDYEKLMRELPFKIIPGEEKSLRSSIFLERAIISERVRLAMGMSLRPLDESVPASEGLEHSVIADKYYEPPLINVIKFACNACPEKVIKVTAMCQGCLAHPCQEVCPKHAISFRNGKSHIDQSLCVKCGRCVNSCPYSAIVKTERPCAAACGMGAIHSDEHGRAEIDYDKCVSCGMCLVNCPFGAIVDKGQIFQLFNFAGICIRSASIRCCSSKILCICFEYFFSKEETASPSSSVSRARRSVQSCRAACCLPRSCFISSGVRTERSIAARLSETPNKVASLFTN